MSPVISVGDAENVIAQRGVIWPRWWEVLLVVVAGALLLCSLVVYYDNVHRATTNGLWKSIDVTAWAQRLPERDRWRQSGVLPGDWRNGARAARAGFSEPSGSGWPT
jgi:hypothetical protein